jgi:hypothetical protein
MLEYPDKPSLSMIIHPTWQAMKILRMLGGTDQPVLGAYDFYRQVIFTEGTVFADPFFFEDAWQGKPWYAVQVPGATEMGRHFGLLYDPHTLVCSKKPGCPWILYVYFYDLREQDILIDRWAEAEKAAQVRGLHACEHGYTCLRDTDLKCKYGDNMCQEHRRGDLCLECYEREKNWKEEKYIGWKDA